uniref:hypothetical protein n=1 Tax=Halorubrum lacusprofundi TaxID=2247 RepID=UPI00159C9382|nr:hypothetical protein [Halorubrum lacusprofundi]
MSGTGSGIVFGIAFGIGIGTAAGISYGIASGIDSGIISGIGIGISYEWAYEPLSIRFGYLLLAGWRRRRRPLGGRAGLFVPGHPTKTERTPWCRLVVPVVIPNASLLNTAYAVRAHNTQNDLYESHDCIGVV